MEELVVLENEQSLKKVSVHQDEKVVAKGF